MRTKVIRFCLMLSVLVLISANAYSQPAFECSPDFYQVYGDPGQLLTYDVLTDTSSLAPNLTGFRVNAIGYRTSDNYAYGVSPLTGELIRIAADGTATNLGVVPGLPTGNSAAGDFFSDGLLYTLHNATLNTFFAINVDTATIDHIVNISGLRYFVSDIAFNPVDGLFYGVSQDLVGTELPEGLLLRIDPVSQTYEIVGPINLPPGQAFGSAWSDALGNVYGSDRATSNFYSLNTVTGNATLLGQTGAGTDPPIDGFSCPNASPFTRSVPTLSEWGLIAMAGILGFVGFMVIRRKIVTA